LWVVFKVLVLVWLLRTLFRDKPVGGFRTCERIGVRPFPSLHHRKEGWPSDQANIAKPPLTARTGWFSERHARKTTPSASASVASRHFLDDAATPPCGDARRGMACLKHSSIFFTASPSTPCTRCTPVGRR